MKNKVGYVKFPSFCNGLNLVSLFDHIKRDLGVDFCITKISLLEDSMIELELYSDKKSWQQEYFVDGLYRMSQLKKSK